MSLHIIIDGYNLIRQSAALSALDQQDIQSGRDALLESLSVYKKVKHHKITVVFDGTNAPFLSQRGERFKGITIRFSRRGESADTVIKRMAAREREKALVVSSDVAVANSAASSGAATISSQEFEAKLNIAAQMNATGLEPLDQDQSGWIPTTRKKGPSRRLPKSVRRSRRKIRKL